MAEINNRQKLLLFVAVGGLLLLVLDSVVFEPLVASWRDRSHRIEELRKKVADGEFLLKHEASISGQWNRMLSNALPSDVSSAESQMLKSFDRWERDSGITRASIKPQWKQVEEGYNTIEYRADYTGDMSRILQFLYNVEKDPVGLKLDSVELSSRDDSGRQISLGIQVSGLVILPQQKTATP
jgi:Tfp pilus assembly protein PilO